MIRVIASIPGSSIPLLFSANIRARPIVAGLSRNASIACRAPATAARRTSAGAVSPAVAPATASRLSSTVLPPRSALPRACIASRAIAISPETSAASTTRRPFTAFAIAISPVAISVPYDDPDDFVKLCAQDSSACPRSSGSASAVSSTSRIPRVIVTPRSPSPSAPSAAFSASNACSIAGARRVIPSINALRSILIPPSRTRNRTAPSAIPPTRHPA